jgi:hypothetical protein
MMGRSRGRGPIPRRSRRSGSLLDGGFEASLEAGPFFRPYMRLSIALALFSLFCLLPHLHFLSFTASQHVYDPSLYALS